MSTNRGAATVLRVLVRSRFVPAALTAVNLLGDTCPLISVLVCAAEIVLTLSRVRAEAYLATKEASSACTSYTSTPLPNCLEIGTSLLDTQILSSASRSK